MDDPAMVINDHIIDWSLMTGQGQKNESVKGRKVMAYVDLYGEKLTYKSFVNALVLG
ncbi:MAG: hypothetical protein WCP19_09310 [Chloroflexota bacterium]